MAVIVGLFAAFVAFVVALVMIISMWKIFVKAGQPGWAAIIPIYNLIVMWQVSRQPVWVLILCFIPFLNVIGTIMMFLGMAESFGKSAGFGIGLWLVPIIFFPILAFGSAQYQ
ncbi:MAG: signal peptidase I [Kiritimatiellaeota bacterium]|nr:signal peptidase I [Kiritimatiellota bacterium]